MSAGDVHQGIELMQQKLEQMDAPLQRLEAIWAEASELFNQATTGYISLPGVESIKFGFIAGNEMITSILEKKVVIFAMSTTIRYHI